MVYFFYINKIPYCPTRMAIPIPAANWFDLFSFKQILLNKTTISQNKLNRT